MKKKAIITVAVMVVIFSLSLYIGQAFEKERFSDVTEDVFYSKSANALAGDKIIPLNEGLFHGEDWQTRGELLLYLYNFAKTYLGEGEALKELPFKDVKMGDPYYEAVCWAYKNGISNGKEASLFEPLSPCTRQEVCTFFMRMAEKYNLTFIKKGNTEQFLDSTNISDYAKSYVVSCKLAGIVNGDENNCFNPFAEITKGESALMLYNFKNSVNLLGRLNFNLVKAEKEEYNYLYENYKEAPFFYYVNESYPVRSSWFDDAVFIGDSVSVMLQFYSAATGELGNASFLCATSISPINILNPVTDTSIHPTINGVKVSVTEGIKLSKAKNIYIMLGINSLREGIDVTLSGMENLVAEIKAVAKDSNIIIQSVTPMTKASSVSSPLLNNGVIEKYNKGIRDLCRKNNWYYVNVAEALMDKEGYLKEEYCSDNNVMGLHFTNAGAKKWADYLKSHVPYLIKEQKS